MADTRVLVALNIWNKPYSVVISFPQIVMFLPALWRKMGVPHCIIKSKARLGALVRTRTCTAGCLNDVRIICVSPNYSQILSRLFDKRIQCACCGATLHSFETWVKYWCYCTLWRLKCSPTRLLWVVFYSPHIDYAFFTRVALRHWSFLRVRTVNVCVRVRAGVS